NYGGSTNTFFSHQMIPNPLVADLKDVATGFLGTNTDIFVDGDLAFFSDTNYCVIFNITDPTNLAWYGDIKLNSNFVESTGIWVFGTHVLSAAKTNGLYFIDTMNYQSTLDLPGSNYADATGAVKVTTSGDYTYVANTTNLIILRHYESSADTYVAGAHIAQSKEVDTFVDNDLIKKATLNAVTFNPPGTAITYFMTVDGINWEEVTPGVEHEFVNEGNELFWRAIIDGPIDRSVHLYELTIDYGTGGLSPMMMYILIGIGGAILLIVLIIVIVTAIKRKKSIPTR
ncbi:MAG: GGIII-like transmembrane region-containing protein, partial [Candidatus Heimdallarchaeota archaeon]